MSESYIEYNFKVSPLGISTEILVAELAQKGFESFVDTEKGILAYIQKKDWNLEILKDIYILSNPDYIITYSFKEIEPTNWNQEWEKNFNPIVVESICTVRAPFHPKPDTLYDIVIEPKMSFGTGHHETTYMMLDYILSMDLDKKSVLDMGCGTGVLAIASALKGASFIDAIDIDTWCYENALENTTKNKVGFINVWLSDASSLQENKYDLVIANINRNILLQDMKAYAKSLKAKGILLLSGFYKEDIPTLTEKANQYGLTLQETKEKNNWSALSFKK